MVNTENLNFGTIKNSVCTFANPGFQWQAERCRLTFCPSHHRSCPLTFPKRTSVSTDSLATPIHPAVLQPDTEGMFCACSVAEFCRGDDPCVTVR